MNSIFYMIEKDDGMKSDSKKSILANFFTIPFLDLSNFLKWFDWKKKFGMESKNIECIND